MHSYVFFKLNSEHQLINWIKILAKNVNSTGSPKFYESVFMNYKWGKIKLLTYIRIYICMSELRFSFTPLMLFVLFFIREWWDLQFEIDFEWQFFFLFLFTLRVFLFNIYWKEVAQEIFFLISFCWRYLTWVLNHGLMSTKSTHYLIYYGDFNKITC